MLPLSSVSNHKLLHYHREAFIVLSLLMLLIPL